MAINGRKTNAGLWTIQGLLAVLFLFAGSMKFLMPVDQLAAQSPVPVGFIRFIGVCEILGAAGLVLPWLLRIRPILTPIAAGGLVIIMIGATVLTAATLAVSQAAVPLVVGVLATVVLFGRHRQLARCR